MLNGYDYTNQAWVVDGKYARCGHADNVACGCGFDSHSLTEDWMERWFDSRDGLRSGGARRNR